MMKSFTEALARLSPEDVRDSIAVLRNAESAAADGFDRVAAALERMLEDGMPR